MIEVRSTRGPLNFFNPPGPSVPPGTWITLQIIVKMLHLSAEMYNNEQVSKVLGRISAKTCIKLDYFGS